MKLKMTKEEFYNMLYAVLGDVTPLKVDCGKLCGGACCEVTDEITGMYLFPGEEVMYKSMPKWGKIYDTDFSYNGKAVELFTCTGKCDRKRRPLSCRIFPLVPYVKKDEKMEIRMDIRGRGMCPLIAAMNVEDLAPDFVKNVTSAMRLCMANPEVREFLYALTETLDEAEDIL